MNKKVYRCVSVIQLAENGDIEFEQKPTGITFLTFGLFALFFNKKRRVLCNKNDIKEITSSSKAMTGKLIGITTQNTMYILEMRNAEAQSEGLNLLKSIECVA